MMRFQQNIQQRIQQSKHNLLRGALLLTILLTASSRFQPAKAQTAEPTGSNLTLVWQTKFSGDAILFSFGDIGIDKDGNVYVSTQGANSVKKFDKDGNFVSQWGTDGSGPSQFNLSLGVGVDGDGNVYVSDFYGKRIEKFDSSGKFLLQWPNESSTSPAFVAADTKGNVYVDEFPPHGPHYVEKFDTSGKLESEWSNDNDRFGGRLEDIAVDSDGNLYVADNISHRIRKLDPDGNVTATFGGEISHDGHGLFNDPFGVSVDGWGNVYVLDDSFLQKIGPDGKFIAQWSTKGGDLDTATNVTVDAQGNIYVFAKADETAASGGTVHVYVMKKFAQS